MMPPSRAPLRRPLRCRPAAGALLLSALVLAPVVAAQAPHGRAAPRRGASKARPAIVIAVAQQATLPIPTLMEGPAANVANADVADQLFLRLAGLGPGLTTVGDTGFVPLLARSWSRRDTLTLVFDLDPRARWHDGRPVTARDVVFTFERARDPAVAPRLATLLRHVRSVSAEGERGVVVRFARAYGEQLYDATFHVAPLPAHLVAHIPHEALARSEFAARPVGNGPYRWVRRVPGQLVELAANDAFHLGAPAIRRVILRTATDPAARLNLLLSGEADAIDNVPPPPANLLRVAAEPRLRLYPVPSSTVGYLLFNARDPADRSRAHPILSDAEVRRAIVLALDRHALVRAVFGPHAAVPYGPVSALLWVGRGAPAAAPGDPRRARTLLEGRGWADRDGDGVLDRGGRPLALTLSLPNTSGIRRQLALLAQEQLRRVGVAIEVRALDGPAWVDRRSRGEFDIDFSSASQDPSPSGLAQSWSCAGGSNVARYCNPAVDSLIERAALAREHAREAWQAVVRRIEEDTPAAFLYAPTYQYAVDRRFDRVSISPVSSWLTLRQWAVVPSAVGSR